MPLQLRSKSLHRPYAVAGVSTAPSPASFPNLRRARWKPSGENEYIGVVGKRAFALRQTPTDVLFRCALEAPSGDASGNPQAGPSSAIEALREYLTLSVSLSELHVGFAKADARFAQLAPYLRGARMLRQARRARAQSGAGWQASRITQQPRCRDAYASPCHHLA